MTAEMPGLQTVAWDVDLNKGDAAVRKGSSHEAPARSDDEQALYPMAEIEGELGLNRETGKSLRNALRDDTHALTIAMREIGVTHLSDGKGRRAMPRLVKIDRSR